MGTQSTHYRRQPKRRAGDTKLDGGDMHTRWDGQRSADSIAHGIGSDCRWMLLDHPELCDSCMGEICHFASEYCTYDSFYSMGIPNNCESMEKTIMMDQFLGTGLWSLLCVMCGAALGVYVRPWIMNKLKK